MNACIIAYTFYEIDFRVRRYAEALVRSGCSVDVFALRRKGQNRREELNGVNIYRLQERDYNEKGLWSFVFRMLAFSWKVFFAVLVIQFRYRYNVVHVHNPPDFLVFSALVPKILGSKIIYDMHENIPEFYCAKFNKSPGTLPVKALMLFEKMATQFADFTIVAHDLLRERVIKRDRVPEKNCVALLNYPSKSFLMPRLEKRTKDGFRIVYPGTISYQHGIDIAIKAMQMVKQECGSAALDIYGGWRSQEYYRALASLVDDLGLRDAVTFHGIVPFDEIRGVLAEASVGVVPKRGGIFGSEAFSTKILEFMASGVPVVVSRTKIDEFYFDSSMVMFFEPENHEDLARCILDLYRNSTKRENLAKRGSEFVEGNNWEVKSKLYLDLVNSLVTNGRNGKGLGTM
jgi:glycosyltransferase involved in cell wall biosynthesis